MWSRAPRARRPRTLPAQRHKHGNTAVVGQRQPVRRQSGRLFSLWRKCRGYRVAVGVNSDVVIRTNRSANSRGNANTPNISRYIAIATGTE